MIQANDLSKQYGEKVLFHGLTWRIDPGDRIALVGPNGAGKTTLARILAGLTHADGGEVVKAKDFTVGYLEQEVDPTGDETVLERTLEAFSEALRLRQEIAGIQAELETTTPERARALLGGLGTRQARLEQLGGYDLESRAKRVLAGLGFRETDFGRSARELSGGWLMRIALARLLLESPGLLILDEPTNHLDLETLEWFEGYLRDYPGALLVISHDRWFINRVANRIADLRPAGLFVYKGDYDAFLRQKAEEAERIEKQIREQDKTIAEHERFIERFKAKASKASAAQSRVKALDRIERIERESDRPKLRGFRFPQPERSGRDVVILDKLHKRYGDKVVYEALDFTLARGERIALVGPNGAGKSTLIKVLAGVLPFEGGERRLGHNVTVQYYAQHQLESLSAQNTVYQELYAIASDDVVPRIRSILGAFLFRGDEVDKKIGVLSGGEKARVALAKMLLRPANFLLLDEPTNHLDMVAREVLEHALTTFEGTICFISHDRYFINAIATSVADVRDGRVEVFPGSWDYYAYKRKEQERASEPEPVQGRSNVVPLAPSRRDIKRAEAELRNQASRTIRPWKTRLDTVEASIAATEARLEEMAELQSDPAFFEDSARVQRLLTDQAQLHQELEALFVEWETLGGQIEREENRLKAALAALAAE
jgi:ATP-binding cassette subfamily F protein 3